jgi:Zn-dependent M28 family amino/carboxypeptidase
MSIHHLISLVVLTGSFILFGFAVPSAPRVRDQQVRQILSQVSPFHLKASVRQLVSFHTRHTLSAREDSQRGIGAAAKWIEEEFRRYAEMSGGRLKVERDEFTAPRSQRVPQPTRLVNVVATLEGRQPASKDRILIVSGHYDSRVSRVTDATSPAPGADDDASGVAAVLEMARVMSRYKFDATIQFIAFTGEEQGLLGSAHWAQMAKQKNWRIDAMMTNDIIGNTIGSNRTRDDRRVRLFCEGVPATEAPADARLRVSVGGENDAPSRQLARSIQEIADHYLRNFDVTVVYRRDRYLRGGDHTAFTQQGYAAVRFTEAIENWQRQHQNVRTEKGVRYGDLPEFVDYNYLAQVTKVNAAALAVFANAPAAPRNVRLIANLSHDTTLRWDANVEPDLAGYVVVWRDTTSPVWQRKRFIGKVTEYTLKNVSKDDFLFGVRAVDTEGHESLTTFPRPATQRQTTPD